MKLIAPAIAAIGLLASTPALAAPVSMTFQKCWNGVNDGI